MLKGISVYAGLGRSLEDNLDYLSQARSLGYERLFTSLHIPEAQPEQLARDFRQLMAAAKSLGYSITADISPRTFALFEASLDNVRPLAELGLDALRLDFGFSAAAIARLTRKKIVKVALNASTIDRQDLGRLLAAGADLTQVEAWHNFYPRPESGLGWELFAQRSEMWCEQGVPVLAFIPSQAGPRAPLYAGLPTVEEHRSLTAARAAKRLAASRLVTGAVFGDAAASQTELAAVAAVSSDYIELDITVRQETSAAEREILFGGIHTSRSDAAAFAVRSQEGRERCRGKIFPHDTKRREAGMITIDNEGYLRYMGEMQLVLQALPADAKVNIAGEVHPADLPLLRFLQPGCRFMLREVPVADSHGAVKIGGEEYGILGRLVTEGCNANTANIDQLDTLAIVDKISREDELIVPAVRRCLPEIAQAAEWAKEALASGGRLIYLGAGTSGRLGILDASECPPTYGTPPQWVQGLIAGGPQAVFQAVEGAEDSMELGREDLMAIGLASNDVVVGIAASGRTPYVLGGMAYGRSIGCRLVALACTPASPLEAAADVAITPIVGPEVIMGSTRMKAGTAQKMVLNMISTAAMIRLGKVYGNLMVDVQATNAKLEDRAVRIVRLAANVTAEEAAQALSAAAGSVKTAVVMLLTGCSAQTAAVLLTQNEGYVARAIQNAAAGKE